MRLEQLPGLKAEAEKALDKLGNLTKSGVPTKVRWKVEVDYGNLEVRVFIEPKFDEVPDTSKYGVEGVKGEDDTAQLREDRMEILEEQI